MFTILFWNVAKQDLSGSVAAIVKDYSADLVILAEVDDKIARYRRALGREVPEVAFETPRIHNCRKLAILVKNSERFWRPIEESNRFVIGKLSLPVRKELLIAATHLPSRLYSDSRSINYECVEFAQRIRGVESSEGTDRTVAIGDFNLNPFDEGLVVASGLHAVMTRQLAHRGSRTVNGKAYPLFYNPMWNSLGDQNDLPPGTYYYNSPEQYSLFWHIFDQVLVRPSLIEELPKDPYRILTEVRGQSLLQNGKPSKRDFSDHLPLLFHLNLRTSLD